MSSKAQSVTARQIVNFLLKKQGLIERHSAGSSEELLKKIQNLGPLHATDRTTPYLSLFARVEDLPTEQIKQWSSQTSQKKGEKPQLYLVRCMRGTLHVVDPEVLPVVEQCYTQSFNQPPKQLLLKGRPGFLTLDTKLKQKELDTWRKAVLSALEQHGPQTTAR